MFELSVKAQEAVKLSLKLLLWVLLTFPAVAKAESLAVLEDIVSNANSFDDFLDSKELRDRYYNALIKYLRTDSQRFPKENYNKLLLQIQEIFIGIPSLAIDAWAKQNDSSTLPGLSIAREHSFEAFNANPVYGIHEGKFNRVLLRSVVDPKKMSAAQALALLNRTDVEISEFKKLVDSSPKATRAKLSAGFYSRLKDDVEIRRAIITLTWTILDDLGFEDDNTVLKVLDKLRLDHFFVSSAKLPLSFSQLSRFVLPNLETLIAEEAVVEINEPHNPGTLPAGKFVFVPTPRPFHAVFKGLCFDECIAGDKRYIDDLTPERWATALLKGAQFYFVEAVGKTDSDRTNRGWVQLLPFVHSPTREVYYNFESGSDIFNSNIAPNRRAPHQHESVLYAWLKAFKAVNGPVAESLILGESNFINNSGSLPHLRNSTPYRFSSPVGYAKSFEHFGAMRADAIAKYSPNKSELILRHSPGRMITDLTAATSGVLRQLKMVSHQDLQSIDFVRSLLDSDVSNQSWILAQLFQFEYQDPQIEQLIESTYTKLDVIQKENVIDRLRQIAHFGVLKPSSLLVSTFMLTEDEILELFTAKTNRYPNNFIYRSINNFAQFFESPRFSNEFLVSLSAAPNDLEGEMAVKRILAKRSQTAKDFLEALKHSKRFDERESEKYVARMLPSLIDHFFNLKPDRWQIAHLGMMGAPLSVSMRLHESLMATTRTVVDFSVAINRFTRHPYVPTEAYLDFLDKLAYANIGKLFSLNPSTEEIAFVLSMVESLTVYAEILERQVPRLKSLAEWEELFRIHREKADLETGRFHLLPSVIVVLRERHSDVYRKLKSNCQQLLETKKK